MVQSAGEKEELDNVLRHSKHRTKFGSIYNFDMSAVLDGSHH